MLFHAKALELYTLAYQHTMAIDEQEQTQVCLYISVCLFVSVCICASTYILHMCVYACYIEIKILVFLLFIWCVHVRTYVCMR